MNKSTKVNCRNKKERFLFCLSGLFASCILLPESYLFSTLPLTPIPSSLRKFTFYFYYNPSKRERNHKRVIGSLTSHQQHWDGAEWVVADPLGSTSILLAFLFQLSISVLFMSLPHASGKMTLYTAPGIPSVSLNQEPANYVKPNPDLHQSL